jgi:predicted nucleic acid-binding protein
MTIQVYLDTSALVKRYVAEAGSNEVAELLQEAAHTRSSSGHITLRLEPHPAWTFEYSSRR